MTENQGKDSKQCNPEREFTWKKNNIDGKTVPPVTETESWPTLADSRPKASTSVTAGIRKTVEHEKIRETKEQAQGADLVVSPKPSFTGLSYPSCMPPVPQTVPTNLHMLPAFNLHSSQFPNPNFHAESMQSYMPPSPWTGDTSRGFRPPPQSFPGTYVHNFSNNMYGPGFYFDQSAHLQPLHPIGNAHMQYNMGSFNDAWHVQEEHHLGFNFNMHHPNAYTGNFVQPVGSYNSAWDYHRAFNPGGNANMHPFTLWPHAWGPTPFFNPAPGYINRSNFYGPSPMYSVTCRPNHCISQPPYHVAQVPVPELVWRIVNQIEYYFSDANLPGDYYLLSLMDDEGWVPISHIAKFNRIKRMKVNISFVLYSLRWSSSVEVKGNKIRRYGTWLCWVQYYKRWKVGRIVW